MLEEELLQGDVNIDDNSSSYWFSEDEASSSELEKFNMTVNPLKCYMEEDQYPRETSYERSFLSRNRFRG